METMKTLDIEGGRATRVALTAQNPPKCVNYIAIASRVTESELVGVFCLFVIASTTRCVFADTVVK
ncbi:MAG TPA: hypothetical protein VJT15_00155 [Pyrinomonadaceae bacterium]|nr:hypothetical protein [Pyrinomonadaceae bacterium]